MLPNANQYYQCQTEFLHQIIYHCLLYLVIYECYTDVIIVILATLHKMSTETINKQVKTHSNQGEKNISDV